MKKIICFVLICTLLLSACVTITAASGKELLFPVTETEGKWGESSAAPGYDGGKHQWSSEKGATFKIALNIPKAGNYEVFYWMAVHENTTNEMPLYLTRNGKTEQIANINQKTGETGWKSFGVFDFDGKSEAYISGEVTKPTARVSGVKLEATTKPVTEIVIEMPEETVPTEETPKEEPEITEDTVYLSAEVKGMPSDDGGLIFPISEAKGKWNSSKTVLGYDGDNHYYTYSRGASFKIGIDVPEAGNYELYYWKCVHENSSNAMTLKLTHNGTTEAVKTIDLTNGETGWESVGVFNFDDQSEAFLGQVIESGMHRVSAVKIVKTDKEITKFEPEAPLVIDVEPYPGFYYPEYDDNGEEWWGWSGSLPGPVKNYPGSLWTTKQGATCTYEPDITAVGNVRISIYKLWYKSGNDTHVRYDVHHNGEVETFYIDTAAGSGDEWIVLGDFYFAGTGDEYVELIRETETTTAVNTRASTVRFDILSSVDNSIWNSIYITPNLVLIGKTALSDLNRFADMDGHWAKYDVEYMADKSYINGKAEGVFAPEDTITRAEATAILARSICPEETDAPSYPDVTPDAWYYKTIASAKNYGLLDNFPTENGFLPEQPITREELTLLIYNAVQKSGKSFPWLDSVPNTFDKYADKTEISPFAQESFSYLVHMGVINGTSDTTLSPKNTATRAEAAALLKRYMETCVWSGPPAGQEWVLTFNDEFNGTSLDWDIWDSEGAAGRANLQSSRWPENAVVEDGMLRLMTWKQDRGGKHWTTASVWVKRDVFTQAYGYWEARYRYCAAQGINNAWWNRTVESFSTKPNGFEIDINEGHYPNKMNSTLHTADDGTGNQASLSYTYTSTYDLSADFHTYAVEWTDTELIYYFDGQEVSRKPNTNATTGVTPWFSTAVMNWAGQISDEADGTSMDVQYVRLYQTKERLEAQQAAQAETVTE